MSETTFSKPRSYKSVSSSETRFILKEEKDEKEEEVETLLKKIQKFWFPNSN